MLGSAGSVRQEGMMKGGAQAPNQRLISISKEDHRRSGSRPRRKAAREAVWLQREERARQYQEKLLVERRNKLAEQRLKEERRRAAVEEKRRQRLEEEKERNEAVVQRTLERSQKANQRVSRWSWRGATLGHNGASVPCHTVTAASLKSLQRVAIASLDGAKRRRTTPRALMDKQENGNKRNSWSSISI
ncbi:hypothetical protein JZ751_002542, partial [Albula glossodonta]